MTEATPTLRVEARFKNARLYNAIAADAAPALSHATNGQRVQELGPIKPWCDLHGISVQPVYLLLNLQRSPVIWVSDGPDRPRVRRYRPLCGRLAAILGRPVEWLFPPDLYAIPWPHLARDVDPRALGTLLASPRQVLELPAAEADVEQRELTAMIRGSLSKLTTREQRALTLRYGLDGADEQTYAEIGDQLDVSVERVRQIEAKAMRKLRHPTYSRQLKPFLER